MREMSLIKLIGHIFYFFSDRIICWPFEHVFQLLAEVLDGQQS